MVSLYLTVSGDSCFSNSAVVVAGEAVAEVGLFAPGEDVVKNPSFAPKAEGAAVEELAEEKLNRPVVCEVFRSLATRCTSVMRDCWAESDL